MRTRSSLTSSSSSSAAASNTGKKVTAKRGSAASLRAKANDGRGGKKSGAKKGPSKAAKRTQPGAAPGTPKDTSAESTGKAPSKALVKKAELIKSVLDKLYPEPPVPLNFTNNFTLLCAVMLSAQTTDGKVNAVTDKLFELAPTPEAMSKLPQEMVLDIVRTVGLAPTKSKNLIAMATRLHEVYAGKVPANLDDLMTLPGVGRKTASVVLAQAFSIPSFPVDTHIHRLALRWGLSKSEKDVGKVEQDLRRVFPEQSWNKLHLQIIYFGREYCPAQGHQPSACPICSWAGAAKPGIEKLPSNVADLVQSNVSPARKGIILYEDRMAEVAASSEEVKRALSWKDE